MSLKQWEKKVLKAPGAEQRVRVIEDELRLSAGLIALREQAGLSQRELADRIGISQPRVAAIERSANVTINVLDQYVTATGARLEVSVIKGTKRTPLLGSKAAPTKARHLGAKQTQPIADRARPRVKKAAKRRSA